MCQCRKRGEGRVGGITAEASSFCLAWEVGGIKWSTLICIGGSRYMAHLTRGNFESKNREKRITSRAGGGSGNF